MVDFRLNDQGEIELARFGAETAEFVWAHCYPELDRLLSSQLVLDHLSGRRTSRAADSIREAVNYEGNISRGNRFNRRRQGPR